MERTLLNSEKEQRVQEAYERMIGHVSKYESFEEFILFFESMTTGKDERQVKQWLLLVLHSHLKMEGFSELLNLVETKKRGELTQWLKASLEKARKEKKGDV